MYIDAVGVRRKEEKALRVETRKDSWALFQLKEILGVRNDDLEYPVSIISYFWRENLGAIARLTRVFALGLLSEKLYPSRETV